MTDKPRTGAFANSGKQPNPGMSGKKASQGKKKSPISKGGLDRKEAVVENNEAENLGPKKKKSLARQQESLHGEREAEELTKKEARVFRRTTGGKNHKGRNYSRGRNPGIVLMRRKQKLPL